MSSARRRGEAAPRSFLERLWFMLMGALLAIAALDILGFIRHTEGTDIGLLCVFLVLGSMSVLLFLVNAQRLSREKER